MDDPSVNCPTCGQPYAVVARNFPRDMTCPNGHKWHTCPKHNTVVLGASKRNTITGCTCSPKVIRGYALEVTRG